MKNLFKLSVMAIAMIALVACGGNEGDKPKEETPEEVAAKFLDYLYKKDYVKAKEISTAKTQEELKAAEQFDTKESDSTKVVKVTDIKCTTQDTTSVCTYKADGEEKTLRLVKQNGKWLSDWRKLELGDLGGEPTTTEEQPAEEVK